MKKIFLTVLALALFSTSAFGFSFFKKNYSSKLQTVPLFSSELTSGNSVWSGTFELVWNDLMDNVVKAPIEFTDGKNTLAENLNLQKFNKDMLSEKAYYTAHGIMNKNFKKTIETALY
ncbi:hypothetical protein IJZ97_06055 [bacterium]|nr:hypothetical protein [bacterium]